MLVDRKEVYVKEFVEAYTLYSQNLVFQLKKSSIRHHARDPVFIFPQI